MIYNEKLGAKKLNKLLTYRFVEWLNLECEILSLNELIIVVISKGKCILQNQMFINEGESYVGNLSQICHFCYSPKIEYVRRDQCLL